MRQIARESGCSHTAIYMYFTDKEALLAEIATPPLKKLQSRMETILADRAASSEDGLVDVCREFIVFSLKNRALYRVFVAAQGTRVDRTYPETSLNEVRVRVFSLLSKALRDALGLAQDDPRLLEFSRILFYLLYGIGTTYDTSKESSAALLARLSPTFDAAVRVCLNGFRQALRTRA